jgi:predicted PurR-regulated permease PerM
MLYQLPVPVRDPLPTPMAVRADSPISAPIRQHRALALRLALVVSVVLVIWVVAPYLGWLVLAAWFAMLARPLLDRLAGASGGRRRAATMLTLALTLVLFVPLSLVAISLALDAADLVDSLATAESARAALEDLVSRGGVAPLPVADADGSAAGWTSLAELVRAHSDRAFELVMSTAGTIVEGLLGFMVLLGGAYTFLVHGPELFAWFEGLAPASHATMTRLRGAFVETGRGLLIGSGLTGLTQAATGTLIYLALGVPRPFVLGFLTLVASVIPGVGTALVWVPVAAGLAIAGRTTEAILMAVLGTAFIAAIDNAVRPFFVRWGRLDLSPFVVMVSVFGGLATAGPWGILLGPIVVRLGLEVLRICGDEHLI